MMKKEFQISWEIYSEDAIAQAIEDFSDITSISYTGENLDITWESEDEIQEVFHEFMNYVLSL